MGPLAEMEEGSKYVLVAVDYFTRWVEAYGIPNQEAKTAPGEEACGRDVLPISTARTVA